MKTLKNSKIILTLSSLVLTIFLLFPNLSSADWLDIQFAIEARTAFAPTDSVRVELRETSFPYNTINDVDIFSWGLNGRKLNVRMPLNNSIPGSSYYIVLKHRNSIETWSAYPVTIGVDSTVFDFTTAINKAYGSNMVLVGGLASIYSGDVNQDGFIDLADVSRVFNDASSFTIGNVVTDLNGDGQVDLTDLTLVFNNSSAFISVKSPLNP